MSIVRKDHTLATLTALSEDDRISHTAKGIFLSHWDIPTGDTEEAALIVGRANKSINQGLVLTKAAIEELIEYGYFVQS